MISPSLRKQIFVALPLSFTTEVGVFAVHKEYAPYAKVTEYLKLHPNDIYMVIDFADDEIYREETPINYVFQYADPTTENSESASEFEKKLNIIRGTRNQCQLNIHLYTTWQPNTQNIILAMDEVLNAMQSWVLFELEKLVDYPRFNSIQAVDETEDRLIHRIISCTFAYTNVPNYTINHKTKKVVVSEDNPPELIEYNVQNVELINAVKVSIVKVSPEPETTILDEIVMYGDKTIKRL